MTKKIKYIFAVITIISVGLGQLKSDLSQNNAITNNLSASDGSIMSLFDPSRFSMKHSFSMSMLSMNSQSIGVASYTNNMNFLLRDNLRLQTNVTFMQPNMISSNTPNPYSNSQSIGVASYTNNMNFTLRDNLRLQTYMTFMQPRMMSSEMANPYSNTQLYFDATLDYSPTPNTHFIFSFGNYPQYSRYSTTSPFLLNRRY